MTESLRKLLRKMGGSPSNGDNSDELVSKIADAYSGGGGALVVNIVKEGSGARFDHTMGEILDAMPLVYIEGNSNNERQFDVINSYYHEDGYKYTIPYNGNAFTAQSLTDYPTTSGK